MLVNLLYKHITKSFKPRLAEFQYFRLKGGADANNDEIVELQKLQGYVYKKVKNYTADKQYPKMINFAPTQWKIK